ncbi:MAG: type II toxin-antitoxin system VapC family toxin [Desulfococcaceae bacterium]
MIKTYFFDSSALVKRYVKEKGSLWIREITASYTGNIVVISRITWVEVLSAFARLQRESKIDSTDIAAAVQMFRYDLDTYFKVVETGRTVIEKAGEYVQKHPLRAYDSVQLASAMALYPFFLHIDPEIFTFVSADDRLTNAAAKEGLPIENPNNYP